MNIGSLFLLDLLTVEPKVLALFLAKMTQLQYLLIHSVWNGVEPIWWVATDDKEEQGVWFGFRFSYDDKEEIVPALYELCQRNLMVLESYGSWREDVQSKAIENPTPEIIRSGFNDRSIYYCLTPEGGAFWEKEFKVDWNRYVAHSFSSKDGKIFDARIVSSVLGNLDSYLEHEYFPTHIEIEPELRTVQKLEPWKVTYWKNLPIGYATVCRVTLKPTDEISIPAQYKERWMKGWIDRTPLGW